VHEHVLNRQRVKCIRSAFSKGKKQREELWSKFLVRAINNVFFSSLA